MGWWSSIWKARTQDWILQKLDPDQVPGSEPRRRLERGKDYIGLFVQSARIVNVRKGLSKFYGTVHSYTSIPHRSGEPAQFVTVVAPDELKNIDARNVDRVVTFRHRVLGPAPYHAGDIGVELGLFSIKSADLAGPFISLLEDLSKTAGVSQFAAALPFAEPLKTGINLLAGGADDSILEIGFSTDALEPETGYLVAMRARREDVDIGSLHVDPSDYRLLDSAGQPVADYPYLLVTVEATPRREDWFTIAELRKPYQALQEAVRKGDPERVAEALGAFRLTALTCFDLLLHDAVEIAKQVTEETELQMNSGVRASGERRLKDLEEYTIY